MSTVGHGPHSTAVAAASSNPGPSEDDTRPLRGALGRAALPTDVAPLGTVGSTRQDRPPARVRGFAKLRVSPLSSQLQPAPQSNYTNNQPKTTVSFVSTTLRGKDRASFFCLGPTTPWNTVCCCASTERLQERDLSECGVASASASAASVKTTTTTCWKPHTLLARHGASVFRKNLCLSSPPAASEVASCV
jgi:hypothetical protein